MRLPVSPHGIRRDAEPLGDGSLGEAGCDRQIDLRPRRVSADRAARPYSPFWHFLRLTPVTARVRYRANKSTLGVALAIVRSHDPARLRARGRRALEPSQSLCFQLLIITRNLIPRNRGAACPLGSPAGNAVKSSTNYP